jgi:hypothetical protein
MGNLSQSTFSGSGCNSSSYNYANKVFDEANKVFDEANKVFDEANKVFDGVDKTFDEVDKVFRDIKLNDKIEQSVKEFDKEYYYRVKSKKTYKILLALFLAYALIIVSVIYMRSQRNDITPQSSTPQPIEETTTTDNKIRKL